MKKRVFALSFALLSVLAGGAAAQELPKSITVATEGAYPPWNFTAPDGSLDGYEIELTQVLCKRMNVECKIVAQDWNGIIPALNAGRYDAIIAGMGATDERKKVVAFSNPYARSPNGFVTEKGSDLTDLPDTGKAFNLNSETAAGEASIKLIEGRLSGKVIGVQGGATSAYFAKQYFKDFDIREYKTLEQLGLELVAGRLDLAIGSATAFKSVLDTNADLVFTGPLFSGGVLGSSTTHVAVRPADKALLEAFNKAVDAVNADGTNKALTEKWFGLDISIHP